MLVRRVPMPLLFVLSALVSLYWPVTGLVFVDRGLNHLPFLVVGMWVGRSFEQVERVPAVLAGAGAAVLFVVILLFTGSRYFYSPYPFIPLGLLGTLMLLLVSRVLARTPTARLLAWAGSGSIGIFLLSAYFQVIGREVLVRVFHTTAPYPQLILRRWSPCWCRHGSTRTGFACILAGCLCGRSTGSRRPLSGPSQRRKTPLSSEIGRPAVGKMNLDGPPFRGSRVARFRAGKGAVAGSSHRPKRAPNVLYLGVEKTGQSPVFSRVL